MKDSSRNSSYISSYVTKNKIKLTDIKCNCSNIMSVFVNPRWVYIFMCSQCGNKIKVNKSNNIDNIRRQYDM